jgi:hypothetical protein
MGNIKIRNLTAASSADIISGNMVPIALDDDAGLARVTRRATFSQIVSGGSGILAADPNSPFVFNNTTTEQVFKGGLTVPGNITLSGNLNLTGAISGNATGYFDSLYITGSAGEWHQITTGWSGVAGGGAGGKWSDGVSAGDIYYNGGNVGIGVTSPGYALSIHKPSPYIELKDTDVGASVFLKNQNGNVYLQADTTNTVDDSFMAFTVDNATGMVISGGKVGIGTSSPDTLLEISAESNVVVGGSVPVAIRISHTNQDHGGHTYNTGVDIDQLQFWTADASEPVTPIRASVGMRMQNDAGSESSLTFGTHGVERMTIDRDGHVGIGNTNPTAPLDIMSTLGGAIMPRMTTAEMNAIDVHSTATDGEMIYNTDSGVFAGRAAGAWVPLHSASSGPGYDSGWSAATVTAASTVTLTHNLGRTNLTAQIWLSRSTETTKGDNPFQADLILDLGGAPIGATITNLTTTEVTLQVGSVGINYLQSNGADAGPVVCYYRIILN